MGRDGGTWLVVRNRRLDVMMKGLGAGGCQTHRPQIKNPALIGAYACFPSSDVFNPSGLALLSRTPGQGRGMPHMFPLATPHSNIDLYYPDVAPRRDLVRRSLARHSTRCVLKPIFDGGLQLVQVQQITSALVALAVDTSRQAVSNQ